MDPPFLVNGIFFGEITTPNISGSNPTQLQQPMDL